MLQTKLQLIATLKNLGFHNIKGEDGLCLKGLTGKRIFGKPINPKGDKKAALELFLEDFCKASGHPPAPMFQFKDFNVQFFIIETPAHIECHIESFHLPSFTK